MLVIHIWIILILNIEVYICLLYTSDLIERFKDSNLPIFTIEELQQLAFDLVGKPQDIPVSDKDEDIVAIVEYRDGSIIDVVRKPL